MGAGKALAGVGKGAILKLDRQIPQGLHDLCLVLVRYPVAVELVQPLDDKAQAQIGGLIGEQRVRLVGNGAQHLHDAAGVGPAPHQIAALFYNRLGDRLEKAAPRKGHRLCWRACGLACRVSYGQRQRDGQVRQFMLGQVVDQKFVKVAAVTAEWHRQIQHHRINRVRVHRQAIAAINRAEVQRECRRAAFNAVIVRGGEGLVQLSHCVGFNRGGQSDIGGGVGQYADVPHRAVRPVNGDLPRLRDAKALLWIGDGGHRGVARYGLRHAQRANLAVQTQGDVRAERHLHRPRRDVVQI